ncbi:unnamed protein product [Phytophthora fragariaefolia]|uniref:Unnamed protein product n=1 Tax=Phytophthora fragariaefolia TaxID=1490495 RepID=A0A9W6YBP9_9STRA|nr:unnamed protein product [Phytophthora fragariaefolia]
MNLGTLITANANVNIITYKLMAHADPLRTGMPQEQRQKTRVLVINYLIAWEKMGKFNEKIIIVGNHSIDTSIVLPLTLIELLNQEFIDTFGDKILPIPSTTSVKSVTRLYAQQERVIHISARPPPSYARAIYRRLQDPNLDAPIDETESLSYCLDNNPHISETERSKQQPSRTNLPTYLDREGVHYRMTPSY